MRRLSRAVLLPVCLAAIGCHEDPPGADLVIEGGRCHASRGRCESATEILSCVDHVWTLTRCEDECAQWGPAYVAAGCRLQELGDYCICELRDDSACPAAESQCMGVDGLRWCNADQAWEELSCSELCASEAPPLHSMGCFVWDGRDACICTAEGTSCEADVPACADASALARCDAGVWVFEDCVHACGPSAGHCQPGTLTEEARCVCP